MLGLDPATATSRQIIAEYGKRCAMEPGKQLISSFAIAIVESKQDGVGEFGTFGELSGAAKVRGGKQMNPPVLSGAFRENGNGVVTRSGYHFRIYLCDADGKPIGEESGTGGAAAERAQTTWCCYAWPIEYGKTGKRAFFVHPVGDVLQVDHEGYSGKTQPSADAAFKASGEKDRITGTPALGAIGRDGQPWKPVG